jgi:hypothetical protein
LFDESRIVTDMTSYAVVEVVSAVVMLYQNE